MVKSMTGFGAARHTRGSLDVAVEIKTVNGRFLKTAIRAPFSLAAREMDIEKMLKGALTRGSVTVTVRWSDTDSAALARLDEGLVRAYQQEFRRLGLSEERIPTMPGVVATTTDARMSDEQWTLLERVLGDALTHLVAMRTREGEALADAVRRHCDDIASHAGKVRERVPRVVIAHRDRLRERVSALLDEGIALDDPSLAREVAFMAERADITEELNRLDAHLGQMREKLSAGGEVGRSLDFLAQEMLREINTIGSKSSDAELAQIVVDMKSEVERIKEQVANIE